MIHSKHGIVPRRFQSFAGSNLSGGLKMTSFSRHRVAASWANAFGVKVVRLDFLAERSTL
jgi:hypothetical protein